MLLSATCLLLEQAESTLFRSIVNHAWKDFVSNKCFSTCLLDFSNIWTIKKGDFQVQCLKLKKSTEGYQNYSNFKRREIGEKYGISFPQHRYLRMSVSWSAHTVIAKIKDFVRENMHLVRSIVGKILLLFITFIGPSFQICF